MAVLEPESLFADLLHLLDRVRNENDRRAGGDHLLHTRIGRICGTAHCKVLPYHNAVFVGLDEHGVARHAHMRSTNFGGKSFRMNVEGSRPQYSFHHIGTDEELFVFESPIDLLSYITLHPESWQEHSYVSLCGTGGQAMHWLLDQCPNIHSVHLALDNDKAGRGAAQRLSGELKQTVSSTDILSPQRKDWNEDLMNDPRRVDY